MTGRWWIGAVLMVVGGMAVPSVASMEAQPAELRIALVGNAGVLLSDGSTSLLVDLPYTSGAHGYQTYEPQRLDPPGTVVSVITHHHTDHFDPGLFLARDGWRMIGPASVVASLPGHRVVRGDSIRVGHFHIVVIPTPHTDDHRSYRIRWRGRTLHVVGDTNDPSHLARGPRIDLLFSTPWLACRAEAAGLLDRADRTVAYHLLPDGSDRICGSLEVLPQGAEWALWYGPPHRAGGWRGSLVP